MLRTAVLSMLAVGFAAMLGCGPVQYLSQVTQRAATEVAAAKTAGADKLAPYEYTMAVLYLHKAREEAGYSDYQAAIKFGKKAEIMAKKARRRAAAQSGMGEDPGADVDGEDSPIDPSATPGEQ